MAKVKELAYLVLDELKNSSDDAFFTIEHIVFLLGKYRAFLLKQRYADIKKSIPNSNYQTICVDLELTNMSDSELCGYGQYLRSIEKIPFSLSVAPPKVTPFDFFGGEISYVNNSRFRYVGINRFLKSFLYATIGPDNHLYIKSSNPQYKYMQKIKITGIFEDVEEAAKYACEEDGSPIDCDEYNATFPLEEALIPPMIQLVVQELTGSVYRPKDEDNNSADDLSGIPTK